MYPLMLYVSLVFQGVRVPLFRYRCVEFLHLKMFFLLFGSPWDSPGLEMVPSC